MAFRNDPLYKNMTNGQKRAVVEFIDAKTEPGSDAKMKVAAVIEPVVNLPLCGVKGKAFAQIGETKVTDYLLSPADEYDLDIFTPPAPGTDVIVPGVISATTVGKVRVLNPETEVYTETLRGLHYEGFSFNAEQSQLSIYGIAMDSVIILEPTGDNPFDIDKIAADTDNRNHWDFWNIGEYMIRMKNKEGYPISRMAELFLYFKEA